MDAKEVELLAQNILDVLTIRKSFEHNPDVVARVDLDIVKSATRIIREVVKD